MDKHGLQNEELLDRRQHQIDDLAGLSLDDQDPLNAVLKIATCDLLNCQFMANRAIGHSLAASDDPLECLENAEPAVNLTVKLANQLHKIADLITKRERLQKEDAAQAKKVGFRPR